MLLLYDGRRNGRRRAGQHLVAAPQPLVRLRFGRRQAAQEMLVVGLGAAITDWRRVFGEGGLPYGRQLSVPRRPGGAGRRRREAVVVAGDLVVAAMIGVRRAVQCAQVDVLVELDGAEQVFGVGLAHDVRRRIDDGGVFEG